LLSKVVTVNYPITIEYRNIPSAGLQPAVEVELTLREQNARTVAIIDSGATHTVFSVEIAELLGIDDVTTGIRVPASTLGGPFDFYLFDLEIRFPIDQQTYSGQIGFSPRRTSRNILGRILFFSLFEVGFRETQQRLNLRPEE
jgi:Aspartyl protease